jgi:hypothetical protein
MNLRLVDVRHPRTVMMRRLRLARTLAGRLHRPTAAQFAPNRWAAPDRNTRAGYLRIPAGTPAEEPGWTRHPL